MRVRGPAVYASADETAEANSNRDVADVLDRLARWADEAEELRAAAFVRLHAEAWRNASVPRHRHPGNIPVTCHNHDEHAGHWHDGDGWSYITRVSDRTEEA